MLPAGSVVAFGVGKGAGGLTRTTGRKDESGVFFLRRHDHEQRQGLFFPYTPPTQFFHGLRVSLDMLFEEGLENVFARHHRLAEGVRRGVAGLGLKLQAVGSAMVFQTRCRPSSVPDGIDADEGTADRLSTDYDTSLRRRPRSAFAARCSASAIWAISTPVMCLSALSASTEMALADAGAKIELGAGVAAAQAYYRDTKPNWHRRRCARRPSRTLPDSSQLNDAKGDAGSDAGRTSTAAVRLIALPSMTPLGGRRGCSEEWRSRSTIIPLTADDGRHSSPPWEKHAAHFVG